VLTVACALPYYAWFNSRLRLKIFFLLALIKILTPLFGYYPGKLVGFGGRESRSLMRTWSYWARFGNYTDKLAVRCRQWKGKIIGIDILGDIMAPLDASANIKNLLPNAKIKRISFDLIERTKGKEHSQWCRGKNTNLMARLIYQCLSND
jgi:predicted alpha/beta hydrolase